MNNYYRDLMYENCARSITADDFRARVKKLLKSGLSLDDAKAQAGSEWIEIKGTTPPDFKTTVSVRPRIGLSNKTAFITKYNSVLSKSESVKDAYEKCESWWIAKHGRRLFKSLGHFQAIKWQYYNRA